MLTFKLGVAKMYVIIPHTFTSFSVCFKNHLIISFYLYMTIDVTLPMIGEGEPKYKKNKIY